MSSIPPSTENSAIKAVERTGKAQLELVRRFLASTERIFQKLDDISTGQAAAWIASSGAQSTQELLVELKDSIKRVEGKVDELSQDRSVGITDRLKRLTAEQQAQLEHRLREIEEHRLVNGFRKSASIATLEQKLDEHARRTTSIWSIVRNFLFDRLSGGKRGE